MRCLPALRSVVLITGVLVGLDVAAQAAGASGTSTGPTMESANQAPAATATASSTNADTAQDQGMDPVEITPRKRHPMFSFGPHVGQPVGLQLRARLLDLPLMGRVTTHSLVGTVGFDWFYRGVTLNLDYRLDFWSWEFMRFGTKVSAWVGGGPRISLLENFKMTSRELPVGIGGRVTPGVTVEFENLPFEVSAYATPLGFDVKSLGIPRWRPEAAVEVRFLIPGVLAF